MNKQTFYEQLSDKLSEIGVGDEYISRHLKQFDGYFAGKSDEEIGNEIEKLGSIDRVASRIKRMTDKLIADEQHDGGQSTNTGAGAAVHINDEEEKAEVHNEQAVKPEAPEPVKPAPSASQPMQNEKPEACPVNTELSEASSISDDGISHIWEDESDACVMPSSSDGGQTSSLNKDMLERNTKKFRIIFAVTLPITLAVVFAVAFLFAAAFFAIASLIIFAVALLVALTAVGTVASIFGVIFGVVQMISNVPIGLYECGIGIIIGSLFMFIGILVYNFAVRLMPFAAKKLLIFAKYVVKKAKELYIYLKKECIGA